MPRPELAITKDPLRCAGKPTVGPTRITVHDIVANYQQYGGNLVKLREDYPNWTLDQINAALDYYLEHREEIDDILRTRRESFAARAAARH